MKSPHVDQTTDKLVHRLTFEPRELRFGTSGRRGELVHLTQLEIYLNALAELKYLQQLTPRQGGIQQGDEFYYAYDLRPSSTEFAPEWGGRGQIAQTIHRAIADSGMRPVNLGCIPTPALSYFGLQHCRGSIMVTGSHIPFDRNGYKLNTAVGELLKEHEAPINEAVRRERERLYNQSFETSLFDENGFFKSGAAALPEPDPEAGVAFFQRYLDFFGGSSLAGLRLLAYQHSAVGRDLLVQMLVALGAEVIPAGRSTDFVPIDTENIDSAQLAIIQGLVDAAHSSYGRIDGVLSTDGDSDRPLILGVDHANKVRFFGGDLVGMVVAEYLGVDAVVVPISCNDAIDRGALASKLQPKTRIGSPFVIAGMEEAKRNGKKVVCGWEANGGFLLGSGVERDGKILHALPTRDAFLPLLASLYSAKRKGLSLIDLFARVATRYSRAGLLKNFPRSVSQRIIDRFSPPQKGPGEFAGEDLRFICSDLKQFFTAEHGFGNISRLNYVDGVRITFEDGEIAHLRPSGNADELRIYAVADSLERAEAIVAAGLAEPHGILRRMEASLDR